MTMWLVVGVCAAALLGTIIQQVVGFGFALLVIPLLSLMVGPKEAVVIQFVAGLISSSLMAWDLRARAQRKILRRLAIGISVGLPIGVLGLSRLPEMPLRIGLALAVLGAVVLLASGFRLASESPRTEVLAGFISGVLNGSVGTGGPPIVTVLRAADIEQHEFRATTSAIFVFSGVVGLPLLAASGVAGGRGWGLGLVTIPPVLLGTAAGGWLAMRVERERFRKLVLVVLTFAAISALVAAFR